MTVDAGATLTIAPATIVHAAGFAVLAVNGTLNAPGTASAPITITADSGTPGDWQSLVFDTGSTGTLSYLHISDGGYPTSIAGNNEADIIVNGGNPTIQHSIIDSAHVNTNYGGSANGIMVLGGSPVLTNDQFTNNQNWPITYAGTPNLAADSGLSGSGNGAGQKVALGGGTLGSNATWPDLGMPYSLGGSVTVASGATLTIDPPAQLRWCGGCVFEIAGILNVPGTSPTSAVTITADSGTPGDWQSLVFDTGSTGTLSYLRISDGGYPTSIAGNNEADIIVNGGNPTIQHSIIDSAHGNTNYGGSANGIMVLGGSPVLTNDQFTNNQNDDVVVENGATPNLEHDTFGTPGNGSYGVQVTDGGAQNQPLIDAQYSDWGSPTGPAGAVAGGQGTPVSTHTVSCGLQSGCPSPDVVVSHWVGQDRVLLGTNGATGGQSTYLDGSPPNNPTAQAGDPVNVATGNFSETATDLLAPGRLPLQLNRTYNSDTATAQGAVAGDFGYGWTFPFGATLSLSDPSHPLAIFGSGREDHFTLQPDGSYTNDPGQFDRLVRETLNGTPQNAWDLYDKSNQRYRFADDQFTPGQSDPTSVLLSYVLDANGNKINLTHAVDGAGNETSQITDVVAGSYDTTTIPAPGRRAFHFSYNSQGQVASVTQNEVDQGAPSGSRTVCYYYDGSQNLTQATEPLSLNGGPCSASAPTGQFTQYGYDSQHRLTDVTDRLGNHVTHNVYDGQNRVTSQVDAQSNTTGWQYQDAAGLVYVTDRMGGITTYTYTTSKNGQREVLAVSDAAGNPPTQYTYDGQGDQLTAVDADGKTTTRTYGTTCGGDAGTVPNQGNLCSVADNAGGKTSYTYDAGNQPLTVTDPNGNQTVNTYDPNENLLTSKSPKGEVTSYAYSSTSNQDDPLTGDLLSRTDPSGRVTSYSYAPSTGDVLTTTDGCGNANGASVPYCAGETQSNPGAHTTTYSYDYAGNRIKTVDPLGSITTATYDAMGDLLTSVDPCGNRTAAPFCGADTGPDPSGHTTTYTYDADGNKTRVTDPKGNQTTYFYTPRGELDHVVDACGNRTAAPFCAGDSAANPTGHTTIYSYNANGMRSDVVDALNHDTHTYYDKNNRVTSTVDPLNNTVTYLYDQSGCRAQLCGQTTARGQAAKFTYDSANRLSAIDHGDGSTVSYTFYPNGQRKTMIDPTGTTTYTYDADNQVTSIAQPSGTVSYSYDPSGNRYSMTMPGSKTMAYSYDADNRQAGLTDWRGGNSRFTYNANSQLVKQVTPSNASGAFGYDAAGRSVSIQYSSGANAPLFNAAYTRDANGNITATTGTDTASYGYDPLNRLTTATLGSSSYSYSYDAAGNRTQVSSPSGTVAYSYNTANELITAGSTTYGYDADGNRTTVNGAAVYSYNASNRLTSSTANGVTASYSYNGDEIRVALTNAGATTNQVLDLAGQQASVVQQNQGSSTSSYLYGGGGLLAQDGGASLSFLLRDHLGSVRQLTDSTGALAGSAAYDPYGARTAQSGASSTLAGFTGQQTDQGSGLIYLRARMYDPATGVFLQRDAYPFDPYQPLTLNRYAYANDNPVNVIDPTGQFGFGDIFNAIGSAINAVGNGLKAAASAVVNTVQAAASALGNGSHSSGQADPSKVAQVSSGQVDPSKGTQVSSGLVDPSKGIQVSSGLVDLSKVAPVSSNKIIAAGSGNIIAAGSGNIIAAGSGNIIAAGSGNIIAAGSGNIIAAGSGNIIAAGSGNIIAAGSGNIIAAGAHN